jgi:pimeloyl-ACP methyl ester carboxylesterase
MLTTALLTLALAFVSKPCTPPALKGSVARCGVVMVADDPAKPNGRTISLNVVVLPAIKKKESAPAMFQLDGGPGIAATNAADFYLGPGALYRRQSDVVLFDQRGTGASNPLRCPALERNSPLSDMYPKADVIACRDALTKDATLANYSTESAADDVDAVRQALGYTKIDLWALSYGTRLAQEYIKRYPAHVSHAFLAGFVPLDYRAPLFHALNAQRVFDLLFFKCQFDASCSAKYPHLRDDWKSAMQAFHSNPSGEALRSMMGTAAGQRKIPKLIHAAAAGDLEPFRKQLPRDSSMFAEGLYLTIACSEGAARIGEGDVEKYTAGTFVGSYRVDQELGACSEWPKYTPRPTFFDPPVNTPPILVIAGEMDQVASPAWAYDFCAKLPRCRYIEIPDLGHGPFDLDAWEHGACYDDVAAAFFRDGIKVDASCIRQMHPPAFE